jgi:HSP20 family protein
MNRVCFPNGALTLHRLQKEMDQLFGGVLNDKVGPWAATGGPAVNVWEKADGFVVEAELPGFSLEDLDVTVDGAQVVLRGERKPVENVSGATVHKRERWYGKFERRLEFPVELDAGNAEATMKNGVLSLTLPKTPAAAPKKIVIKNS